MKYKPLLIAALLSLSLLCASCADKLDTIEGRIVDVQYMPTDFSYNMIIRFEDGRIYNYEGWFRQVKIGSKYKVTVRNGSTWHLLERIEE